MSVDPVHASSAGVERQTPEKKVHTAPPPPVAASGHAPKPEIATRQNVPAPPLIPEHEVKVQLDTSANDVIVYQVLDKQSGTLVLQVPSAAQIRGIQQSQELLQRIASRGKAATSDAASAAVVKGEGKQ
jgi:hypothetical protein